MSLTTNFTVIFPNGFNIKKPKHQMHPLSKDQDAYEKRDFIEPPSIFDEEHIPFTLQELLSNFHNINNIYKSNPDKLLDIDKIFKFLTTEESLKKNVLTKIEGKTGRCVISKKIIHYNEFIYYIPILKETRKKLLILFNTFIKCSKENIAKEDISKENIIIYEDTNTPLFIHLYAIIIDSLHVINPLDLNIKNCTDIFPLITLLEILLNKKYKTIIQTAFQKSRAKTEDTEEPQGIEGFDDDWDKDDFDPTTLPIEKPNDEKPNDEKPNEKPNEKNIEKPTNNKPNDMPADDIPDEWDSI